MEAEGADFQDWELLHSSDSDLVDSSAAQPESFENARNFEGIEGDSEGIIRSDYFSIDSHERYAKRAVIGGDGSEAGSVESDNPSWIDPGSETRYRRRNSGEFWSDSGSDRSEERKSSDFEGKNELGLVEKGKIQVGFEGVGEMKAGSENLGEFGSDEGKNELGSVQNAKIQEGFEEFGEIQTQYEDSGGDSLDLMEFRDAEKENEMNFVELAKTQEESEFLGKSDSENDSAVESEEGDKHSIGNKNVSIEEMKSDGAEGKKNVAWWKVPLELLKYCVFRVSPVWSVSVAAALMGFVILGRRLYKMKRKSRSLELKVTVDDKKVSQFMSRAARLNEAFSVVRRVPIIRPSLPAAGVTPWPVMSLR